jgi:hypothetical protein
MHKQPGWVYVGDGWLRYADADGWTDHYLLAGLVHGSDWPLPAPAARFRDRVGSAAGLASTAAVQPAPQPIARVRGLLGPGRSYIGRHRAEA